LGVGFLFSIEEAELENIFKSLNTILALEYCLKETLSIFSCKSTVFSACPQVYTQA
jgi:hypothetical protein